MLGMWLTNSRGLYIIDHNLLLLPISLPFFNLILQLLLLEMENTSLPINVWSITCQKKWQRTSLSSSLKSAVLFSPLYFCCKNMSQVTHCPRRMKHEIQMTLSLAGRQTAKFNQFTWFTFKLQLHEWKQKQNSYCISLSFSWLYFYLCSIIVANVG